MKEIDVPVITIDGPSGVGKGTLCRMVAAAMGFGLLDSGALYRLTGVAARKQGVALDDELAVADVARAMAIEFVVLEEGVDVRLDGLNVTSKVRSEQGGMDASIVAAHPAVRAALLECQRDYASLPGLVADGRDMGTTVFPQAPVKIYLQASAEERAQRRYLQYQVAGSSDQHKNDSNVVKAEILQDIIERDRRDSTRESSPLKPAEDAVVLDTTELDIPSVFEAAMAIINARLPRERI